MCGIWSLIQLKNKKGSPSFDDFYQLKHRGPDNSYFESYGNVTVGFHRLAIINDTFSSNQPFLIEDSMRTIIFVCNGEIYNFKDLIHLYDLSSDIENDCMVIPELYWKLSKHGEQDAFMKAVEKDVKGEFSFLLFEFDRMKNLKKVIASRDTIGIRPLYYSPYQDNNDSLFFTSELKGGLHYNGNLIEFPPGHYMEYHLNELGSVDIVDTDLTNLYLPHQLGENKDESVLLKSIQESVMNSVRRRLSADKPFAFLLSGGVDSSLVAALSAKILGKPIRTFCCSMKIDGQPVGTDLVYARNVADHIGSNHTEVFFTPEEGFQAIPDVIRTIESWDTTTVRASVGQYMVCKWIGTHTDCKVVMVGEGPDEVCSSYLFNWYAPSGLSLGDAAHEYVKKIHFYDVKRADRCISRWGLEGRVPLLDPEFIQSYWDICPIQRMPVTKGVEKWWLRQAFEGTDLLPSSVLWRTKEAFSDGVSGQKSWYQIIQEAVEPLVTDEELANAEQQYPYCTPRSKEAYYYRKIFCEIFGNHRQNIIPGYWQPKWTSGGKEVIDYIDPSARVLDIYHQ